MKLIMIFFVILYLKEFDAKVRAPPPRPPPVNDGKPRLLTTEEGCGIPQLVEFRRIVGGEPAKLGAWPWSALVGYTDTHGELTWRCGGSLITSRTTVRLGEHDLSSENETLTIDVPVVKVARYPKYTRKDGHNDLAVLYLESVVNFTDTIRPICIATTDPLRSKDYTENNPFIAGWGRTQEGGNASNILQQIQITVLPTDECKESYKKIGKLVSEQQFDSAVLCAKEPGKDSCQGDSGGAMMMPEFLLGNFNFFQIGIVSYGIGCARDDIPGIYTRVQSFVDWIQEKVNE